MDLNRSAALFRRACDVIPGGTNSPVRAHRAVGGTPLIAARAAGAEIWDADGRCFVDLVQSYGAILLGHAHPVVVEAIVAAAAQGTSFGATTEREVLLAERIVEAVPSIEKVRLVNSGTEATMTACRIARGATGRDRIVKFAGNYHGHADALLAAGGSGVATLGLSGSAGVADAAVADTIVAPYNRVPVLDRDVAAVIVEPVAANMGVVAPLPGFLEGLRQACDEVGALLIFDEVITGFRLGSGGAQAHFGVRPDLTCLGKVIGGGLPIGAVGGRADVMDVLAPDGPVYQAGTLSGNPLATAAGLAALDLIDDDVYAVIEQRVEAVTDALRASFFRHGVEARVPVVRTVFGVRFAPDPAADYDDAAATNEAAYATFFHAASDAGISIAPGAYEACFVGLAHDDDILERLADGLDVAVAAVAAAEVAA